MRNIQECWGGNVYMRLTGDIFAQVTEEKAAETC